MTAPHDTPEAVETALFNWRGMLPYDAEAMLRRLLQRVVDAERERDGANALVERMHSQDVLAIKAWHKAHPRNDLTWPDQMRLTAWCMGSVAQLVAERDAYRGNCTDALAENDALRFERNNPRAAPEPRKPWEVLREAALLREAADIIARESGHTKGEAAFDFLTFEAARLEAAAAPKPPTLAEAVRAYVRHDMPNEGWYNAMMEALARAEKGA